MRRVVGITLGLAAALAVVLLARVASTPIDLLPQEVDGLPIRTISEALGLRDGLDESQPIAVRGWYSTGFAHSCPAPMGLDGKFRNPSPLELYCRRGEDVLAELREAAAVVEIEQLPDGRAVSQRLRPLTGPHLDPVQIGHMTDLPITPPGIDSWIPQPIVAVGHFNDHRAKDCPPAEHVFCLGAFVIDHIPVIRGTSQGTARQPIPGLGAAVQTPALVEDRVRDVMGGDVTVLSTAAYRGIDLPSAEDRAPRFPDRDAVWLVRIIDRGPDGSGEAHLASVVIDDASLAVRWSSLVIDEP
jgi:hypothetical protein